MSEVGDGTSIDFHEKSFDSRFRPETVELFGGTINAVDVAPEIPDPQKIRPVLLDLGFGTGPIVNKGPIRALVGTSRRVISLSHLLHGGRIKPSYETYLNTVKAGLVDKPDEAEGTVQTLNERWQSLLQRNYPRASLRHALTILALLEEKKIDKVDAVGASQGGIDTTLASYIRPDKFGNLVLIETAGMHGEDTRMRLIKGSQQQVDLERQVQSLTHEPLENEDAEAKFQRELAQINNDALTVRAGQKNMLRRVLSNPKRIFYDELRALIHSPIGLLLPDVRANGIGVALIHGVDDPTIPFDAVINAGTVSTDTYNGEDLIKRGSVDGFVSVEGNHTTLFHDPRIMQWTDHLLTNLANKQNKSQ